MPETPLTAALRPRPERVDRLPLAPVRRGRRPRRPRREGVDGVTSNPTIFQAAIAEGDAYDDQLREVAQDGDRPEGGLPRARRATTSAAPATSSAPCGTTAARDAATAGSRSRSTRTSRTTPQATIDEAKRLHAMVDRPNLFIKIPATAEGLPAIEETIARRHPGQRHADLLARAPPRGGRGVHPRPPAAGRRPAATVQASRRSRRSSSRASTPRPTSASTRSAATTSSRARSRSPTPSSPTDLPGGLLRAPSGRRSAAKGATAQRCLWASTSTKNPDYRDVLYVEELIGPDTVNTMPRETVEAFQDHGEIERDARPRRRRRARSVLEAFAGGRASTTTTSSTTLEREGVEKFAKSFKRAVRRTSRPSATRAGGRMSGDADFRRELGQQLRVDSVRSSAPRPARATRRPRCRPPT